MSLLEIEDLHVVYGRRRGTRHHALRGVTLSVDRGETLGIIGESGCGKSTLARSILRLVDPASGSIRIDGADVARLPERRFREFRRRVQMVFQDPVGSLNPRLSVGAQLGESLRLLGDNADGSAPESRIAEALRGVGLDPSFARRRAHELSGGQAQRIAIARALLVDPDVMVLDEPTSALDVTIQAQVLRLVRELMAARPRAYVYVSHDLATVRGMCDRVAVLYLGRVVEEGPTDQVFTEPAHPYTRALLSEAPSLRGSEVTGPVRLERALDAVDADGGCALAPRCPFTVAGCREAVPVLAPLSPHRAAACSRLPELPATRIVPARAVGGPLNPR
ncbi:ABC transporter ATP-binding protein [Sphaerisporangium sp. NPDC051011]|uniref:ABC transporter ATP-binding protein n=1 Tax=Sphaerisporangium sp. NPDC051011 TaxID=3155792 RepID=UPI0033E450E1